MLEGDGARQSAQINYSIEASAARPVSDQRAPGMVEVHVETAGQIDQALTEAVTHVTPAATSNRMGIMITRLGVGWYIVRAHPQVPFGLTRQQHC